MAETFGNLLWSYRMGKHVDLPTLAQATGVGQGRLQIWEDGQALPRAEVVVRDLGAALELSAAQREALLTAWHQGRAQAAPAAAPPPDEPPSLLPPVDLPDLALLANNLIGQGAAYQRLWALFEQIAAGRPGQIALVCGRPGHSRSALAHAVADDAQALGAAVLRARFWPLARADEETRAAVWQEDPLIGPEALALEPRIAQEWPAAARLAGPAWVRLAAQAAALLEQTPTPKLLRQPDSPEALRALLWRLAADRPAVLVLDGFDHAPEPWPDLLADLAPDPARGLRLLTLATLALPAPLEQLDPAALAQERVRAALPVARRLLDQGLAQALWLGPVSPAEVLAFTGLPEELAARLHTLSGGVPAAVESLWFDWQDAELVVPDGRGGWTTPVLVDGWLAGDPAALPARLLAAHMPPGAALGQADALRVLACAALEGPSFTAQAVAEALGLPADAVLDLLDDTLLDSPDQPGLVCEVGFVDLPGRGLAEQPSVYRFAAPHLWLLWARHGLPEPERAPLRRALADALERVYHPQADWAGERLIELFEAAGLPERAETYRRKRVIDPTVAEWLLARLQDRERESGLDALDQRRLFDLRLEMSAALFAFGHYEPGLAQAEAALEQARPWDDPLALALAAYAAGAQSLSLGRLDLAQQRLGDVLSLREQALPAGHPEIASALDYLGTVARMQGAPERAAPLLERAVRIREQALGAEHPATAASLHNLGAALVEQGQPEQAAPLLERAMAVRSRLHGEPAAEADTFQYLGSAYRDLGRLDQARPLFERALALHEQAFGPNHPVVAGDLHNLANLYHAQGLLDPAWPLYERALALSERIHGPDHPATAQVLNNLAVLLHSQGDLVRARGLFVRALGSFQRHLPPDHPAVLGARQWVRMLQADLVLGRAPAAAGQDEQIALLRRQAEAALVSAGPSLADRTALATALEARARWAEQGEPDGSPYRALAADLRALIVRVGAYPHDPDWID